MFDCIYVCWYLSRGHETVDRGLLKSLLGMLADLQMYHNIFELHFLQDTETLYHTESLEMLRDTELTVCKAQLTWHDEHEILLIFFHHSSPDTWYT